MATTITQKTEEENGKPVLTKVLVRFPAGLHEDIKKHLDPLSIPFNQFVRAAVREKWAAVNQKKRKS